MEVIAADVPTRASTHCLDRVLAGPVERVRALFLDPRARLAWNSGTGEQRMKLEVGFNGELMLEEFHHGMMVTARISVFEHGTCSSVVRVRLSPQLPHDLLAVYALGIDDLWEERLYAITDALLEYSGGHIEQLTIPDPSEHLIHKH